MIPSLKSDVRPNSISGSTSESAKQGATPELGAGLTLDLELTEHRHAVETANRIFILIEEVVADVDKSSREIGLDYSLGRRPSFELRVKKREMGQHRWCTSLEAIEVVRKMAGRFTDELIAATLSRIGLRTGVGNTWNKPRVYSLRQYHQLPAFDPDHPQAMVTLKEAEERLHVSPASIRRMIAEKMLPASQVVESAPWKNPYRSSGFAVSRNKEERIRKKGMPSGCLRT